MKKVILVMELPKNCKDCNFFGYECRLTREKCNWYNQPGRHETCPLRPLPDRMEIVFDDKSIWAERKRGWNACLDAIETED